MSVRAHPFLRRRMDGIVTACGLALLSICAFIARDGRVGASERAAFEAINHLSGALEPLMHGAQYLGVLLVGPVVALVALILRRWRLACAAVAVTAAKLGAERLVWQIVQRDRPGTTEPNAIVRGGSPTTGLSFVSGHVVLTAALAWVITPYLHGRWRAAPWLAVALVGFARIYLGAHNPLDVVGGLGLGVAIGALANLIVGRPQDAERPGSQAPAAPVD